uniref:Flocculation protein FLO11-like n=1 Tax=Caenorhabditis tropicalis TaxID=1561998 RepID=A0A1I7TD40_9PELO
MPLVCCTAKADVRYSRQMSQSWKEKIDANSYRSTKTPSPAITPSAHSTPTARLTPSASSTPSTTPSTTPSKTPSVTPPPPAPSDPPVRPPAPSFILPAVSSVPVVKIKTPLKEQAENIAAGNENKIIRLKRKEKTEKDAVQLKTTTRSKKKNSATHSISLDAKTSSENDGPKKKSSSEDSGKKKSLMENKSEGGSKEQSETDEKTPQKMKKEITQNFFKHMMESQRARRRTDDARLETMPESSQMNRSARSIKKKTKKTSREPLEKIFKENGEPVWVVQERPESEWQKNEDGVAISNPELALAMSEENVELDEKTCLDRLSDYISCTMSTGTQVPKDFQHDSSASFESLESNNEYFSHDSIVYNTVKNMVELSDAAIKRFEMKKAGMDGAVRPNPPADTTTEPGKAPSTESLKTGLGPNVTINLKNCISVTYDRQHPIASIKKFRKRMNNTHSLENTLNENK